MIIENNYRYFIRLAYNGKNYHGWQVQDNAKTVQGELNKALSLILRENVHVVGCGRTDTGVHASLFYAHFDFVKILGEEELLELVKKVNRFLKDDIVIYGVFRVDVNLHSRFDAKSRTYKYYIHQYKDVFINERSYFFHHMVDLDRMNEAATVLYSHNDFSCFSKSGTQTKTNNCRIELASWEKVHDNLIFTIKADRFLRNMVRAIVGTLLEVGVGKIDIIRFEEIILNKNRSDAGYSVPGHALFLSNVEYDEFLENDNLM